MLCSLHRSIARELQTLTASASPDVLATAADRAVSRLKDTVAPRILGARTPDTTKDYPSLVSAKLAAKLAEVYADEVTDDPCLFGVPGCAGSQAMSALYAIHAQKTAAKKDLLNLVLRASGDAWSATTDDAWVAEARAQMADLTS